MQAKASFACLDGTLLLSHKIRIPTESMQRGHDITICDFNYNYYNYYKNASFRTYSTFVHFFVRIYPHINMRTYVGGCVRAGAYNLILIFASYYSPWTWICSIGSDLLVAAMHDRAACNMVALRMLTVVFLKLVDVGCFSPTLELVGEKFTTPHLSSSMVWWKSLFSHIV